MRKIHKNIPIFIPHMGCPNMCVFCNQRSISGQKSFDRESVKEKIWDALKTIPADAEVEIAYFGGSFTGIERELMIYLLDVAESFVRREDDGYARVCGIRMSTRPDYINGEILDILSNYTVSAIELGLQSMDGEVLSSCRRGHTSIDAEAACRQIKERGYYLVGQMMIGLPASTLEKEVETAKKICSMGCDGARIYPTVVFYDTELAAMTERGEYTPLSLDDAVKRSAAVLDVFNSFGVDCIRIGLCASDNLSDDSCVMGGANHPALGELVLGEVYYNKMRAQLEECNMRGGEAKFAVPHGHISKAIGQKGKNRERLRLEFSLKKIEFKESDIDDVILI